MNEYVSVYASWSMIDPPVRRTHTTTIAPIHKDDRPATFHEEDQSFAQRMQHMRIAARMSVATLAEAARIPAERISSYERGDEEPSDEVQRAILVILRTDDEADPSHDA